MKNIIIAALIAATFTTTAFAASTDNTKVLSSFKEDYAAAENVEWKVSKDIVKASFEVNGEKKEAFYTTEGSAMDASKKAFDKLPTTALRTITQKYQFPKYKLTDCKELKDEDGNIAYFLTFDKKGKSYGLKISAEGEIGKMNKIKVSK